MNLADLQSALSHRKLNLRLTFDHRGWCAILDRAQIVMFGTADTIEGAIVQAIEAYDAAHGAA